LSEKQKKTKKQKRKLELKMFYQTYTARKPPKSPAGSDGMMLSGAAARCLQRAHTIRTLQGVTGALSAFYSLLTLTWTLTFRLIRARDQERLHCEFGANTFSGSQDI